MSKQCVFMDNESGEKHGGIILDDGSVLCGCCGGLFPSDEVDDFITLIRVFDVWVDLTDAIID